MNLNLSPFLFDVFTSFVDCISWNMIHDRCSLFFSNARVCVCVCVCVCVYVEGYSCKCATPMFSLLSVILIKHSALRTPPPPMYLPSLLPSTLPCPPTSRPDSNYGGQEVGNTIGHGEAPQGGEQNKAVVRTRHRKQYILNR